MGGNRVVFCSFELVAGMSYSRGQLVSGKTYLLQPILSLVAVHS